MKGPILDASIAISNQLVSVAGWFEDRGHPNAHRRIIAARSRFDRGMCKALLGHPRIVYGPTCDICLDCLSIVDEHFNGRGRGTE